MKLIISSCGTSLLTNLADSNEARSRINKNANKKNETDLSPDDLAFIESLSKNIKEGFAHKTLDEIKKSSAELHALISYYHGNFSKATSDHHILICTDTYLGKLTADLVKDWLRTQNHYAVTIERRKDLQTENIDSFHVALSELVKWAEETLVGYKDQGYDIIFNLTGGFKSINGFLQTLAMFYADEVFYIFERSTTLLTLPRLPIKMDVSEAFIQDLALFRRLAKGLKISGKGKISDTFLMRIGEEYMLSYWGDLVWNRSKREIYERELYPPPSDIIRFSDSFRQSTMSLPKNRINELNDKMDDLAICIENGTNLKSLDLKPLKGNPKPPSTHEIDAWADQDAKRIFGHFEGKVFVLDRLDKALH